MKKIEKLYELDSAPIDCIYCWSGNLEIYNPPSQDRIIELAKDINKYGLLEPIIVNQDGVIISGNTRYKACKFLDFKTIKIKVVDISEYDPDFVNVVKAFNNQRKKTDIEIFKEFDIKELTPYKIWEKNTNRYKEEIKYCDYDTYEGDIKDRKGITKYDNDLIKVVIDIINNSEYILTVRSIHYQVLNYGVKIQRNQHIYSNNKKDYQYLSNLLTKLRVNGTIPYKFITDNTRKMVQRPVYENVNVYMKKYIENFGVSYYRDMLKTQRRTIIVVCEKETLSGPINDVCDEYGLSAFYIKGNPSIDVIYKTSEYYKLNGSKPLHILFLTDFDPAGLSIQDTFLKTLQRDFNIKATYTRVGITEELIKKYNLPPDNEVKLTDAKAKKFIKKYNTKYVYELEAMKVDELMKELDIEVIRVIDLKLYDTEYSKYEDDLKILNEFRRKFNMLDF